MMDRLPPLTALRAFEAAARHMSFAMAADELSVTPAALSFQIKSLEAHLGAKVFRRLNRAVELTPVGRVLAPGCLDGFQTLSRTWSQARKMLDNRSLTVTAGPAFTAKWLAPRLYEFAHANPEIELRLSAALKIMDFDRDDIDVAIRFGETMDAAFHCQPLVRELVSPVMIPELARTYPTPESLLEAPLIHDRSIDFLSLKTDWRAWFEQHGLPFPGDNGPVFNQADHAMDAALSGGGVALGRLSLISRDLARGSLVAPYKIALDTGGSFRFLCPKSSLNRPQITAFEEWITAEMKSTVDILSTFDVRTAR